MLEYLRHEQASKCAMPPKTALRAAAFLKVASTAWQAPRLASALVICAGPKRSRHHNNPS